MCDTIVLIHGNGTSSIAVYPLKKYLEKCFPNAQIITPTYDTKNIINTDMLLDRVDTELLKYNLDKHNPIIVVGQSLGGIAAMNLDKKGWNIHRAVAVCSPLNGARFIGQLRTNKWVKFIATKILANSTYTYMLKKEKQQIPLFSYRTISFGLFNKKFDGSVYVDESMLEEKYHKHEPHFHHIAAWFTVRLFKSIYKSIIDDEKN
jgi:pimeloyl-ACP methyl ester carboxylesterase